MYSKVKELEEKIKYPCLMISKIHKTIIWFTEPETGRVVNVGTSSHSFGFEADNWGMVCFEPFEGSVELSNNKL